MTLPRPLTRPQIDELLRVAAGSPVPDYLPAAGWSEGNASRVLKQRGLIELFTFVRPFGGKGGIAGCNTTWNLARLTKQGEALFDNLYRTGQIGFDRPRK